MINFNEEQMKEEIKFYQSQSNGLIEIRGMDYTHLLNAIRKLENTVFYHYDDTGESALKIASNGKDKPVYKDLVNELSRRNPSERFNTISYVIEDS